MLGNMAGLQFEQSQKLKLTPSQLRTIEILQMSSVELQQKIADELLENPVLEPASPRPDENGGVEETVWNSADSDENDDIDKFDKYDQCEVYSNLYSDWKGSTEITSGSSRVAEFEAFYKSTETLREHLMNQLMNTACCDKVRNAVEYIIYSLDSNGYLDISFEEIIHDSEFCADDVTEALGIVRGMHPSGLAAWTLEECLRLQLDDTHKYYEKTCRVIDSMLNDVATGDLRKISRALQSSSEETAEIIAIIKALDPKPGARFSDGSAVQYVIPDVEIEIVSGKAVVCMTDVQPPLALSSYYGNLLKETNDKEVVKYLNEKIDSAKQLILNIEQRKRTVESVTVAILARQRNFLEPGNKILEPLTMQQIADDLGLHVSTVSRAVRDKYIRFPTATYPLKYFFTNEVSGVSRDNIYSRIKAIIASEDRSKPLSDQSISDILMTQGIKTSRRTVAKYRDSMGILPKSMRKDV